MHVLKLTLSVATLALLAACGGTSADGADQVTVEMQTSTDQTHLFSQTAEKFVELVDEYSDGEIEVKLRYGSPYADLYGITGQVSRGQRDMAGGIFYPEIDKRLNIAIMGGLVTNWDEAEEIYGPEGPMPTLLNEIAADSDLEALATAPAGFGGTVFVGDAPTEFPITEKLTVRVPPYDGTDALYQEMGYNTVVMDFGEVYTALQTGTINGKGSTPPEEVVDTFAEISDTYLVDKTYFENLRSIVVNTTWLDSLDEEHQEALRRAGAEATAWAWTEGRERDAGFLEEIEGMGVEVITLPDEQLEQLAELSREVEWPVIEQQVGPEVMDKVRDMVG